MIVFVGVPLWFFILCLIVAVVVVVFVVVVFVVVVVRGVYCLLVFLATLESPSDLEMGRVE